jgi:exodeoxyribonuclease VIII
MTELSPNSKNKIQLTADIGIQEGVYTDLSNEEYHGHKESISRSALMDFSISPYTYWANHINPNRPIKEKTPQMEFGSAFHTIILEPKKFNEIYAVMPPKVLLKDVGRELYDSYKLITQAIEASNKIILSPGEMDVLLDMKIRLNSNKEAMALIEGARIENSFFWQDEHSGLLLKARPDILHENMIVDLKTCSDACPRAFQSAMVLGGYHLQGAMMRDGVEALEGNRINKVINICIETKYPHNMAIYIIDEFAIHEGHMKYKQLCLDLKAARKENNWQDYGVMTIGLPKWAT